MTSKPTNPLTDLLWRADGKREEGDRAALLAEAIEAEAAGDTERAQALRARVARMDEQALTTTVVDYERGPRHKRQHVYRRNKLVGVVLDD